MRLTKLSAAAAAAGSLLAVALAPVALARPALHPGHTDAVGCRITVNADPHVITTGENAEVFGALICPGNSSATVGQTVTIYAHTVGIPGQHVVGTTSTGSGGAYALPVNGITADTRYYATAAGARSNTRIIRVSPIVTLKAVGVAEGAAVKTGPANKVAFTGTVLPGDNGAQVWLQREAKTALEEWITIDGTHVHGTSFTIIHKFVVPGDANLRVVVRPHNAFDVRGVSNLLSFEITQAQNPNLEINTSSYSVPYGSPVTISGVLKSGASGQKVTLFSRLEGVPEKFQKLTEGTTGAGGSYSFTIASATANTQYYVTSGGFRSAILFQGVKYLLNTNPPPATSAHAGTPLTFTGMVTPAPAGKTVYLERENASVGGFHVVTVAPLKQTSPGDATKGGTYELTWWFYGSGPQTYRVRVAGDPSNQAASGTPFTVDVTAPLGPLTPGLQPTLPH
jgi:hypothetical protein